LWGALGRRYTSAGMSVLALLRGETRGGQEFPGGLARGGGSASRRRAGHKANVVFRALGFGGEWEDTACFPGEGFEIKTGI